MTDLIIALFGASATGKTSLADYLVKYKHFAKIKTTTTRPKRTPDEDDYHFVSKLQFKKLHTFASTFFDNNYYGSNLATVKNGLSKYHHLIIILTWSGVKDYINEFKGTNVQVYPIELYAPERTILDRLQKRSDNHITKADVNLRLKSYQKQALSAERSNINSYVINSYNTDNKIDSTRNEAEQLKRHIPLIYTYNL